MEILLYIFVYFLIGSVIFELIDDGSFGSESTIVFWPIFLPFIIGFGLGKLIKRIFK